MLSVLENAYFKKAQELPNFNQTHQKILFMLMHENKHFTKHELLCFANYDEEKLDNALRELEQTKTIKTEGWLVKINDLETLNKQLIPELASVEVQRKNKLR